MPLRVGAAIQRSRAAAKGRRQAAAAAAAAKERGLPFFHRQAAAAAGKGCQLPTPRLLVRPEFGIRLALIRSHKGVEGRYEVLAAQHRLMKLDDYGRFRLVQASKFVEAKPNDPTWLYCQRIRRFEACLDFKFSLFSMASFPLVYWCCHDKDNKTVA
ncbi:uncharacterized protein [Triticum aestivum]|uniref:uncharacterized protein n=1 Tax=Triticum aestivum TaxID=4565 RepID=UPI001D0285FF|nr:uncharacterized protein LOC123183007 [Triticum aestivum]